MNTWSVKSVDQMKITQDTATNPPSASHIDSNASKAKDLGATHLSISVPYDLPNGGGDVIAQTQAWADAAKKYSLNIFHRHSWCSDQGWYGVPQDTSNDRIQDTVNWIKAHPSVFQNGDIFTPKPEPSNMGIAGQDAPGSVNRFPSVAAFNTWLRQMRKACQDQFDSMGLNIKVGYWGFDGFVLVGYNNPDHQGTSLLESATVTDLGNLLAGDHYPSAVGKPMTDFLNIFHQVFPGVQYFASEIGPINNPPDLLAQLNADFSALANDPLVVGANYWVFSDNGTEALLDDTGAITPLYTAVQGFFQGSVTPTPTPVPPVPTPTPPATESVISFTLINADTNQPIRDLVNGETIDMTKLPTKNLNVRVNTNPSKVGSVKIEGEDPHTENDLPYSVYEDNNGVYLKHDFEAGMQKHTITATPFSQSNLGGTPGTPLSITFATISLVTPPTPTPTPTYPTFHVTGNADIQVDADGKGNITLSLKGTIKK